MTPFERINNTVRHRPVDRIPVDFGAEEEVVDALIEYLGLHSGDDLLKVLEVDKRSVGPKYVGPPLRKFENGMIESIVSGGPVLGPITTSSGKTIWSIVRFPWAGVEKIEDLEGKNGWNGHISWWDFSTIMEQIHKLQDEGQYWISTHGDPSGLQHLCMWAGDEKFLMTLAAEPDLAVAMIEKHNEHRLQHALKTLEAGGGKIHELSGGGDYGTQNGLIISKEMFRKYFKPLYMHFFGEIKKNFDVEIFFHSCGSIEELIPDLIEVGVTILNPIQVRARNMEIGSLKKRYGDRLTFNGGIDIQELLPNASVQKVRKEVRRIISLFKEHGGYIMAPTHVFQPDTPIENILAVYEVALGKKLIKR